MTTVVALLPSCRAETSRLALLLRNVPIILLSGTAAIETRLTRPWDCALDAPLPAPWPAAGWPAPTPPPLLELPRLLLLRCGA